MRAYAARRVLAARRRGGSLPVRVQTDAGVFFTKLRGAADGTLALVAEIIVAELAEALGLRVPARALVRFDEGLESDDRDSELADVLAASRGLNLGFEPIEGAVDFRPDHVARVGAGTASTVVWLDGLVMNPDRSAHSPNLLFARGDLWLIDHGAALFFHHDWPAVSEDSPRRAFERHAEHVLRERATRVAQDDGLFAEVLDRDVLRAAVAAVPDDFLQPRLGPAAGSKALARRREAYVAFLWKRLAAPRPFVPLACPA